MEIQQFPEEQEMYGQKQTLPTHCDSRSLTINWAVSEIPDLPFLSKYWGSGGWLYSNLLCSINTLHKEKKKGKKNETLDAFNGNLLNKIYTYFFLNKKKIHIKWHI